MSRQSPNGTYWKKRALQAEKRLQYIKALAFKAGCVEYPHNAPGREIAWWAFNSIPGQDFAADKLPPFDVVLKQAMCDGDEERQ